MPNPSFSVVGILLTCALLYASFLSGSVPTVLRTPVSPMPLAQLYLTEDEWQRGLTDAVREIVSEKSTGR